MKIFSLALRPETLSALVGQDKTVAAIRKQMTTRPPCAFMFTGGTGTGKTTIARILSIALNCNHMKLWGDPCAACQKLFNTLPIHEINASKVSGVEELEKVTQVAAYKPLNANKRVIILDEFQRASTAAQNLLLKPFEDPAPSTVWIVCTTEPTKVLATLRRRLTTYNLKQLDVQARETFLTRVAIEQKITTPLAPLLEQIQINNIGSPALLLMALEKYAAGTSAAEAISNVDASSVNTMAVCKAVTGGDWKTLRKLLEGVTADEVRFIRASVAGWLKGFMRNSVDVKELEKAAISIHELTSTAPYDESLMLVWLWSALFKIQRRYRT